MGLFEFSSFEIGQLENLVSPTGDPQNGQFFGVDHKLAKVSLQVLWEEVLPRLLDLVSDGGEIKVALGMFPSIEVEFAHHVFFEWLKFFSAEADQAQIDTFSCTSRKAVSESIKSSTKHFQNNPGEALNPHSAVLIADNVRELRSIIPALQQSGALETTKTLFLDLGESYERVDGIVKMEVLDSGLLDKAIDSFRFTTWPAAKDIEMEDFQESLQMELTKFCRTVFLSALSNLASVATSMSSSTNLFLVDIPNAKNLASMRAFGNSAIALLPHSFTSGAYQMPLQRVRSVYTHSVPKSGMSRYAEAEYAKFRKLGPLGVRRDFVSSLYRSTWIRRLATFLPSRLLRRRVGIVGLGRIISAALRSFWEVVRSIHFGPCKTKTVFVGVILEWHGYGIVSNYRIQEVAERLESLGQSARLNSRVVFLLRPKPGYLSSNMMLISASWIRRRNVLLCTWGFDKFLRRSDLLLSFSQHSGVAAAVSRGREVYIIKLDPPVPHSFPSDIAEEIPVTNIESEEDFRAMMDFQLSQANRGTKA